MKVMVISLIMFFIILNLVSAININFYFPEKVYQNKEFYVNISDVDAPGVFDVKIYVTNQTGKIISEIYNEKWQNSMYYIDAAYPSHNSFKLIIDDQNGAGQICVKFRQTGKSSALSEVCKGIEILKKEESLPTNERDSYKENNSRVENSMLDNRSKVVEVLNDSLNDDYLDDGPIILEPKKSYQTSNYDYQMMLIYLFLILCVLIIILLALRRI